MNKWKLATGMATLCGLALLSTPAWSATARLIITKSTIFKSVIDVRDGIKNKIDDVLIKDNLHVEGNLKVNDVLIKDNLHVEGNLTVDDVTTLALQAEDIVVTESGSNLSDDNLQDVLTNQLAIDLSSILPGSWTVTNTTNDIAFDGYTAAVEFADGILTIDDGRMAAGGIVSASNTGCNLPSTDISYQVFGSNMIYVEWESYGNFKSTVLTVFAQDENTLSMVGGGGMCGADDTDRISTLTRVIAEPTDTAL